MSLSNELSSEIVLTILSRKSRSPQESIKLRETLSEVQALFQKLERDWRNGRRLKVDRKAESIGRAETKH
jgi:hypothetical protein